jgi:prephenate dehydrogenase
LRVAILGVGLIGGSIGLAARRRAGAFVRGYDPDPAAGAVALQLGAIDAQAADLASAVAGAEIVFVAAPVGAVAEIVRDALALAGEECVVSDVGSTKGEIARAIEDPRFVGGHPLAGSRASGARHARADLFERATWYLSPAAQAPKAAYERLCELIVSLGAEPVAIDVDVHDRLMAVVSQLPHVLANLLIDQLAHVRDRDERPVPALTLGIGPSFRDATRVAGSNSAIWTDIYLSNRAALTAAIDELAARLTAVRDRLQAGDRQAIDDWNERARGAREALLPGGHSPSTDAAPYS